MLDAPAPPMRSSAEILSVARDVAARRSRLTALGAMGSGILVAAIAVAVFVVPHVVSGGKPTAPTPIAAASHTPPLASMPVAGDVHASAPRISTLLAAAIPAGLTAGPMQEADWSQQLRDGGHITSVRMPIHGPGGTGELDVSYRFDPTSAFAGDTCSLAAAARVEVVIPLDKAWCLEADLSGQPIRVTISSRDHNDVTTATRFLTGGFVTVVCRQGSLTAVPLTTIEVATIAANPSLLP